MQLFLHRAPVEPEEARAVVAIISDLRHDTLVGLSILAYAIRFERNCFESSQATHLNRAVGLYFGLLV